MRRANLALRTFEAAGKTSPEYIRRLPFPRSCFLAVDRLRSEVRRKRLFVSGANLFHYVADDITARKAGILVPQRNGTPLVPISEAAWKFHRVALCVEA